MTDTYEPTVSKLVEQLIEAGTKPIKRRRLSCYGIPALYDKGGGIHDIEIDTDDGIKRFTNAVADRESGRDAQSGFGDVDYWPGWRDPPFEEAVESPEAVVGRADRAHVVVEQLEGATGAARRQLIIEAEAVPFEGQERQRLIELLKDYIEENRDSTDRNELIAVGSAIRKCVALLDSSEFGWLATLLESGHRAQPSLDAELEIAKMVFRRYSVSPPAQSDPHPQLSARLAEMANDYLRPRVFSRERFSTVAMLAIQALLVMRSEHAQAIIDQVNDLPFGWFRQQLRRRMDRTVRSMRPDATGVEELDAIVRQIWPE